MWKRPPLPGPLLHPPPRCFGAARRRRASYALCECAGNGRNSIWTSSSYSGACKSSFLEGLGRGGPLSRSWRFRRRGYFLTRTLRFLRVFRHSQQSMELLQQRGLRLSREPWLNRGARRTPMLTRKQSELNSCRRTGSGHFLARLGRAAIGRPRRKDTRAVRKCRSGPPPIYRHWSESEALGSTH